MSATSEQNKANSKSYGDIIAENFITRDIKLEMMPLARNKIRVRIENIADHYDNEENYFKFNMKGFAEGLYFLAND